MATLVLLAFAMTGCVAGGDPDAAGVRQPGASASPTAVPGIRAQVVTPLPRDSGGLPGAWGPSHAGTSGQMCYTVVLGDYARAIAARFGVRVEQVTTWSGTRAGKGTIHPGQVLCLCLWP